MNQYDLSVKDMILKDVTVFLPNNKVAQQRRVTFYVGDHGPFTKDFAIDASTTAAIKAFIDEQVSQVSELTKYGQ